MSIEFGIDRVSPWFITILDKFGKTAFDVYWDSDLIEIEDGDIWTEDNIHEHLEAEDISRYQNVLGDLLIPLLREGQKMHQCRDNYHECFSFNGKYIAIIHHLLTGKIKDSWFFHHNFLVKEISAAEFIPISKNITLVNALCGGQKIKNEAGCYVSYLKPNQVKEIAQFLPTILEDDFDFRWLALQELENDRFYDKNHSENSQGVKEMSQRWRAIEKNPDTSFSEQFSEPNSPREFIEQKLIPFYQKTAKAGDGILIDMDG